MPRNYPRHHRKEKEKIFTCFGICFAIVTKIFVNFTHFNAIQSSYLLQCYLLRPHEYTHEYNTFCHFNCFHTSSNFELC